MNHKTLVAYFSASGTTAKAAERIAAVVQADLFEIVPAEPYTKKDLNWNDTGSRSSVEMKDPTFRPAIAAQAEDMEQYDTVLLGFPIWWYIAPTIINTFLESHDFGGKRIVLFATSGGSGFGETLKHLKPSCSDGTQWVTGKVVNRLSDKEMTQWLKELGL